MIKFAKFSPIAKLVNCMFFSINYFAELMLLHVFVLLSVYASLAPGELPVLLAPADPDV